VEHQLTLNLDDLYKMRSHSEVVTMECAGNNRVAFDPQVPGEQWRLGAVSTAEWTGVPLVDVLDRAKLTSAAREVLFRGGDRGHVDGRSETIRFERSLGLHDIEDTGALLPLQHGYPLRLVVPGWYGVASVKWLTAIEVLDHAFDGHFQTELYRYVWLRDGHAVTEPVRQLRVRAVITEPSYGQTLTCGDVSIRGLAWSGIAPIAGVRVRVGRQPWKSAHLRGQPQRHGWRSWELSTRVDEAGTTTVQACATDLAGRAQPDQPEWNPFGYGGNSVHTVSIGVV
jgi:DMSO/TMAO reductase YedYZ molybdopterin-dependent catalytic subunit